MHESWCGLLVIIHKQFLRAGTGYWSLSTNSAWELVRVTGHYPQTMLESWYGFGGHYPQTMLESWCRFSDHYPLTLLKSWYGFSGHYPLTLLESWCRFSGHYPLTLLESWCGLLVRVLGMVSDNAWQLSLLLCKDIVMAGWCVSLVVDCLFLTDNT